MRRLSALLSLAALLAAPALSSAQSAADSAHVRATGPAVASIDAALTRYCRTKSAANYVCAARAAVVSLRTADSALLARPETTVVVAPPPVDSVPGDTGTSTPPEPTPTPVPSAFPVPPNLGAGAAAVAELPRDTVDVTYPLVTRVVRVAAGADLQVALNAAQPGDELRLAPGAVFTGDFLLPKHAGAGAATCSQWIVVRSDVADSLLGAGRMTPSRAAALRLARIQTPDNQQAIGSAWGVANVGCWRLTALDVTLAPSAIDVNGIVRFGDHNTADSTKQAHHLVLDRAYVHGVAAIPAGTRPVMGYTGSVRRCAILNSRYNAIVDSWLEYCRGGTGDAQAVLLYAGTGPYLIRNNTLSGGTEVVMLGGATSAIVGARPSDVTIHGNLITRELADTLTLVKNLFEVKNADHVDFAGNVTRLNWINGQAGYGWLVKSVNQSSGSCTWCHARDITIRYNTLTQSTAGVNLAGIQEAPAEPAARYTLYHNVIDSLGFRASNSDARPLQLLGGGSLSDVIYAFNTIGPTSTSGALWGLMSVDARTTARVVMQSNVWYCGGYGIKGSGTGQGTATLDAFMVPYTWSTQALYGCSGGYPAGSTYSTSLAGALATGLGAQ